MQRAKRKPGKASTGRNRGSQPELHLLHGTGGAPPDQDTPLDSTRDEIELDEAEPPLERTVQRPKGPWGSGT